MHKIFQNLTGSQKLLGHSSIKITMDRYVHVTTESLDAGVRQFEMNRVSWEGLKTQKWCGNGVIAEFPRQQKPL